MKKLASALLAIITLICVGLTSCSEQDKILGKWRSTQELDGMIVKSEYDFQKDGILKMTINASHRNPSLEINISVNTHYTFKNKTLKFSIDDGDCEINKIIYEGIDIPTNGEQARAAANIFKGRTFEINNISFKDNIMSGTAKGSTISFVKM